jgi:hypothetical protein
MTRKLKTLGMALAALFAMSAVAASTAAAQGQQGKFTSESGNPVTVIGTEIGLPADNQFTTTWGNVSCPGTTYTGHELNSKVKGVPHGATTATLTPHYKQEKCVSATGSTMTIDTTGCDFVLHAGATTPFGNLEGTYGATMDVVCPVGATGIHLKIYSGSHANTPLCTMTVSPQNGLKGAHLKNTAGQGGFDLTGTFENITAQRTQGLCRFDGHSNHTAVAKLDINATVKDVKGVDGVTVTDEADPC